MARWRVLIVDDEEDVRFVLRSALDPEVEVAEAVNGLDALERIDRVEPDMVVLDVNMPVMDGFAACEAIRRNPRHASLPVMFLTSRAEREDYREGYAKGADFYMPKPFETDRFLRNVQIQLKKLAGAPPAKKYTIEELGALEAEGAEPESPGSDRFAAPENQYTRIVAKLPASAEPSKLVRSWKERGKTADAPPGLKPRVMVVDDDPDVVTLMKSILADRAEVVWAMDGADAIERLVRWQPDIMVIDINMPRMNGYQLCQSLRLNTAFRRLPILVCSGETGDRERDRATRSGATAFLPKPFAAADLLAAIDRIARDPSFAINPSKTMPHADILRALKTAERASKETRTPKNDAYSDLVQKLWQSEEE